MSISEIQLDENITWGMNQVIFALFKESPMPTADKIHLSKSWASHRAWCDVIGFKQAVVNDGDHWGIHWCRIDALLGLFFGQTTFECPEGEPDYIQRKRIEYREQMEYVLTPKKRNELKQMYS